MHQETRLPVRVFRRPIPRCVDALSLLRQGERHLPAKERLLLESAAEGEVRQSTLILSAALRIESRGDRFRIEALNANGEALLPELLRLYRGSDPDAREPGVITLRLGNREEGPSPLDHLRRLYQRLVGDVPEAAASLHLAGIFSYDFAERFMELPEPAGPSASFPDLLFFLADRLLVAEPAAGRSQVILLSFDGQGDEALSQEADGLEALCALAGALQPADLPPPPAAIPSSEVQVDCSDQAFAARVASLQATMARQELQQVVLSRTFSLPCPDPLAAYERLRALNPSPHLFYLDTGDILLFGASPESAIRVRGQEVEIAPIAGTRPRSPDPAEDARIEEELLRDPKELTEHRMLVELAGEDLASLSGGACRVEALMQVERYSHVMHLVSRLSATLAPGKDALHAYQACLNMGTVTGAPKRAAMALLREEEPGRRGPYGGAVACLRGDGSLDSALIIRSAWVRDGVAEVRAGAGVVASSVPLAETAETRRKAAAVLQAIAEANTAMRNRDIQPEEFAHGAA